MHNYESKTLRYSNTIKLPFLMYRGENKRQPSVTKAEIGIRFDKVFHPQGNYYVAVCKQINLCPILVSNF